MEWSYWNWINLFFVFFNLYLAIGCFKDENEVGGHVNMFAVVINGIVVASRLGL